MSVYLQNPLNLSPGGESGYAALHLSTDGQSPYGAHQPLGDLCVPKFWDVAGREFGTARGPQQSLEQPMESQLDGEGHRPPMELRGWWIGAQPMGKNATRGEETHGNPFTRSLRMHRGAEKTQFLDMG